ncbi:MAG: helix-turn-helix transcriptional regulator [Naasia sp.]|uniref:PadR family transcriptional regulator n=1 Tax=Naasia sp. TaxID=2546198 RepID=UPI002614CB98|nr:PadR family transcriptional regulator [Naasia sp.]MCU1570886.1 helix-turn-helix transcriptional regulator [Naasia sp.]
MISVFGHGRFRLYLLALLEERPRHGYELIQALEERSGGTYSPSAGTIYPRLAKLEEEGLVARDTDGRRTVYSITDAGREELDRRRGELGSIEEELTDSVRRIADEVRSGVDQAMRSLRAELAAAASTAKAEPRRASSGPSDSGRALRDADVALTDFRQRLRGDLRAASARGEVPAELVAHLEQRLTEVRAEIVARLP